MESGSGSEYLRDYLDFDLEIREGGPRGYSVAVRSPAGEAREEMSFPFDDRELRNKLRDLEVALLRSGGTRRHISPEEQTVRDFGKRMFEALLVGDVRTRYLMSLDEAAQQDKGLRLKLRVRSPQLAILPWEFLYDPDYGDYLCLSSDTPIVRYVDLRRPVRRLVVTPPLKILGMVASPRGLDPLDVEHEQELVDEAIEGLRADGLVELTWLEGQTWRHLQRAMRRGPWHVFHFVGHGDFDPEAEEGVIALRDEETGRAHLLESRDLARLLDGHRYLRLVLLNSCEGARGSEGDPFSGTAATLVRRGIPAVVAMQYEITDRAAIEFSRAFYEATADGWPVDAAVGAGRTAVSVSLRNTLEWGTPVLYMRSPDGRLFDISISAPRAHPTPETEYRQEEDPLRRYREGVESAWVDGKLQANEVQRLRDLANNELKLSPGTAVDIEREIMGDTIEVILQRQKRAAEEEPRRNQLDELYARARKLHQDQEWQAVIDLFAQIHSEEPDYPDVEGLFDSAREALEVLEIARKKEDALRRYREAVEWAWTDEQLSERDVQWLSHQADRLNLSRSDASAIEHDVMDETKEEILERQEQAASEKERKERLDGLYAQARRSYQHRQWQAVVDVFAQIHPEDPAYRDPEGLLASAREALEAQERAQRVAAMYDQALRHMDAEEWQQALECFEEVQRLEPGYRDNEELLSRVRLELTPPPTAKVPDLSGQEVSQASSVLTSKGLELGARREVSSDTVPEGRIIEQSPEAGGEVQTGSSVSVTVSSGPSTVEVPDIVGKSRDEERSTEVRQAVSFSLGDQAFFDELTKVCGKYTGLGYYVNEAIPEQNLADARSSIPIPTGERVIALVDNSSILSRGIGLAVCGDGIRWRNYAENPVSKKIRGFLQWPEFADVPLREHQWAAEYGIEIGQDNMFVAWKDNTMDQHRIVKLLLDIQSLVKSSISHLGPDVLH